MYCEHCSYPVAAGHALCVNCGKPIAPATAQPWQPPAAQLARPASPVGGLTTATAICLGLVGLAFAADVAARVDRNGPDPTTGSISSALMVAVIPLYLVWLWRIRRNAARWGRQRHSQGWAIGGWFVPVLFLWVPYQLVVDAWRASQPPSGRPRSTAIVTGWWVCWLLAWFTGITVGTTSRTVGNRSIVASNLWINLGSTLPSACFAAAAAILGALVVWSLGRRQAARLGAEDARPVLDHPTAR